MSLSARIKRTKNKSGFYGINSNISLTYSISNFGSKALSIDTVNGPDVDSITFDYNADPVCWTTWLTPPVAIPTAIPMRYPFTDYRGIIIQDTVTTIAAGGVGSYSAQNITFPAIPSKVLIYLRENDNNRNWSTTDTYARIDSININFNNKSGLLAGANSLDLYRRSCINGLKDVSWPAWERYVGSPLMLEFGKDIPLDTLTAVDMIGSYTFKVQVNYTNISSRAIKYDCIVLPMYSGIFTLQNYSSSLVIGLVGKDALSLADIAEAENRPDTDFHDDAAFYYGGASFSKDLKKLGTKALSVGQSVVKGAEKAADYAEKIIPYVRRYAPSVSKALLATAPLLMGLGASPEDMYEWMLDAGYDPMEVKASGIVGGGLRGGNYTQPPQSAIATGIRKSLRDRKRF